MKITKQKQRVMTTTTKAKRKCRLKEKKVINNYEKIEKRKK